MSDSFIHTAGLFDAAPLWVKLGVRHLRPTADFFVDQTKNLNSFTEIETFEGTYRGLF